MQQYCLGLMGFVSYSKLQKPLPLMHQDIKQLIEGMGHVCTFQESVLKIAGSENAICLKSTKKGILAKILMEVGNESV